MSVIRNNDDLDEFMSATATDPVPRRKKRKFVRMKRDEARRRAFRVLAQLSDLEAPLRAQVLKVAIKLSVA